MKTSKPKTGKKRCNCNDADVQHIHHIPPTQDKELRDINLQIRSILVGYKNNYEGNDYGLDKATDLLLSLFSSYKQEVRREVEVTCPHCYLDFKAKL